MRLLELSVENIGPFDAAKLDLTSKDEAKPPVTLITGENGTGKSILLDAIRGVFGQHYANLERRLWREPELPFAIRIALDLGEGPQVFTAEKKGQLHNFVPSSLLHANNLFSLPALVQSGRPSPDWVVDYWRSSLATNPYAIQALTTRDHKLFLQGSLQGGYANAATTQLICGFDYLRDSHDLHEKRTGEALYAAMEKIVNLSLLNGRLKSVARTTFTPMVEQSGQVVPLGNVSSGNAYLVHHLIGLLSKMYAVQQLRGKDPSTLLETPGVLLLDEAENHLHPRWQKRLVSTIHDVFPNLQIVATTHSPFVVTSTPWARIYVCRYDQEQKTCTVTEETDAFSNLPVEEILASDVFGGTRNFGEEMTTLLDRRKTAIQGGDVATRAEIERELKRRNPGYFEYLDLDERLREVRGSEG